MHAHLWELSRRTMRSESDRSTKRAVDLSLTAASIAGYRPQLPWSITTLTINNEKEFERNMERYEFLKWGQGAFSNFRVVPPGTGIVHQVNLEYLAKVVWEKEEVLYPDSLVGTDSHTTMINGLGVLGWGVGGIEAEAVMLGQPIYMLIPEVVGVRLTGKLPEGTTATDLVLRVTELLRAHGVVNKFVEFFGAGLADMPLANRATIANMAPEYGATCGFFPIDEQTLAYMRLSGREESLVQTVEAYAHEQGLWRDDSRAIAYSSVVELDQSTITPSLAGPSRPQDRVELGAMQKTWKVVLPKLKSGTKGAPTATATMVSDDGVAVMNEGQEFILKNGAVVIAAITSCTNTSNPSVMIGAGLLAKKARALGLQRKPWVKSSLAPGSKVVTEYLKKSGSMEALEELGFNVVGYGCTTCIGNSGPLPEGIDSAIKAKEMVVASVLSGNRNFEARVHPDVKANYLASPPLVVAYAIAGTVDIDLMVEPLGTSKDGKPVYLRDVWPSQAEVAASVAQSVTNEQFRTQYAGVFEGSDEWREIATTRGDMYQWNDKSTYIQEPPFFTTMTLAEPGAIQGIRGARCLVKVGDSVTTDHISPAGNIKADSPAGKYLEANGVDRKDFNSYGSRRGNHEVMIRGTFANIRLKNLLLNGVEGGFTRNFATDGGQSTIYEASVAYQSAGTPLVILAGKEYGSGSSRDWAAKGTALLGVRAVIAESFERIHRSNLIGMGVLPLQFKNGESAQTLGLTGEEVFSISGITALNTGGVPKELTVTAANKSFTATVRIDTPGEADYYRHGGIMQYVLRSLLNA